MTTTHGQAGTLTAPALTTKRHNTGVVAGVERNILIWIAERLPRRVNSDHLTALALASMLGAGLAYWLASVTPIGLALVVFFLALNWFGDSLDGTLARVRNQQRPRFGFYVDHVVDALGATFLLGGLGASGFMSPIVAGVLAAAYLLLLVEVFLATHVLGTFRMSYFRVGPTELRIILSIGTFALATHSHVTLAGRVFLLFDVGGLVAAAGLVVTFLVSAITTTRALHLAEPVPAAADQR
jgi:archaetidylinositol phosphate synthase